MIDTKKKIADDLLIKVSAMKPVIKPTIPHKHEGYHELIFLCSGAGHHQIDEQSFTVKPFTGFSLKLGQVHCWDFAQIPNGFVVLFKEALFADKPSLINQLDSIPCQFDIPEETNLFSLLQHFYKEYQSNSDLEILTAYLTLIIHKTQQLAHNATAPNPSSSASDFYRFRALVNQHFGVQRKIDFYAQELNMSPHRLNSVCKATAKASATDIIKQRVLIEAKNLITHTGMNVSEIAYSLGFSDASNFIKFFKAQAQITPNEYRARLS